MKNKLLEKAPPGKKYEKLVLNLKKKYGETSERPFAIAWSIYNKNKKHKHEVAGQQASALGLTGVQDQLLAEEKKEKRIEIKSVILENTELNFEDFLEDFFDGLVHYFGGDNVEDITDYKEESGTILEVNVKIPEITDSLFWIGVYPSGKIEVKEMENWNSFIFSGMYQDYDSVEKLISEIHHLVKRDVATNKRFKQVYENLIVKRLKLI
jgi:hypothetical protein